MVLEKLLIHRLPYLNNILQSSSFVYYICCHVVVHKLGVNKLISIRDYEKNPHTYFCNIT